MKLHFKPNLDYQCPAIMMIERLVTAPTSQYKTD